MHLPYQATLGCVPASAGCWLEAGEEQLQGAWMSSSEVRALQAEVVALRARLEAQEERLQRLEDAAELRSEIERSLDRSELFERRSQVGSVSGASYSVVAQDTIAIATGDVEKRLELARQCGLFLRRALSGDFRGGSGRDRLRLGSRLYVVCADFGGTPFDPPRVFKNFTDVKGICKEGRECGASVFLGFVSKWEAREAVNAAGFARPAELA